MASLHDAQAAIFKGIVESTKDLSELPPSAQAEVLAAAGFAFRAAVGGQPIGGVTFGGTN